MIKIGRIDVSLELRQLFLNGQPLRIGTRAFDILEVLIKAEGQVVSKEALFAHVWPKTVVEESNLQVQMSALRKLLGEDKELLKTVPGLGYRLIRESGTENGLGEPKHEPAYPEHHLPVHNIPLACAPLIGRKQALENIQMALGLAPLVTLVGTGGIGKTELGLEVARAQLASFRVVRYVNLSSVDRDESTLDAIRNALAENCPEDKTSLEQLIRSIGHMDLLIVLDNCEHVIQRVAAICEQFIHANPHLRILATSREPLRVRFEQVYWVPPLEVPAEDASRDAILKCSAVQMFLSRIHACDPNFRTDDHSIRLIGTICRRLDGVPLALELAAGRVVTLGMGELAAQLDDRFRILTDGLRTAPARQQTLKAALDWSYQFLCARERTVLRRLGIFRGRFQLSAACAIAALEDLSTDDVTEAIAGLVSKSLLMSGPSGTAMHYHLLETTRAYALQMLAEAGESETMMRRHEHYARAQTVTP